MAVCGFAELILLSHKILEDPKDFENLKSLKNAMEEADSLYITRCKKPLLACFFPYLKMISEDRDSLSENQKLLVISTVRFILERVEIDNKAVFFNFYSFFLFELYDHVQHKVLDISEEQKLTVLETMTLLVKNVSLNLIESVYCKKNVPKLSQIIYVCGEMMKNEKSKEIRTKSLTCLMAFAKVLDTDDQIDRVLSSHVSEVFMFFLPGIVSSLSQVILESTWTGHKMILRAIKAFGRIVTLVMQNYHVPEDNTLSVDKILMESKKYNLKLKWKNQEEINAYIHNTTKSSEWYNVADENLCATVKKFINVTNYENSEVRSEMSNAAILICRKCDNTLPLTVGSLIELLIVFSEDTNSEISESSRTAVGEISENIFSHGLKNVFESLEDKFFVAIESLPRKFNSVDEKEKKAAMNLVSGYVKLFGSLGLEQALKSNVILDLLVETMLHVNEIETSKVSLMEEYDLKDISTEKNVKTSWIFFKHYRDEVVSSIKNFCALLSKHGCFEMLSNKLLDTFFFNSLHKKEAIYLLNLLILGLEDDWSENLGNLNNIIKIYTDETYNDLTTCNYSEEDYTNEEIKNNVIQVCLLTEGVGLLAFVLKNEFQKYLLQCTYLVLSSAGSGHPLLKNSGLVALNDIIRSCGYSDVTELVNSNFDYFSYQVSRKLNNVGEKEDVLNILAVVLNYCNVDILTPICQLVENVLLDSHNKFKQKYATIYLKVFKDFILAIKRWFDIKIEIEPVKSRKEKETEYEEFKVTGADKRIEDYSDDILGGKSAEVLYEEDREMERLAENEDKDEYPSHDPYKKPEPPLHIKIVVQVVQRSLHFLPSKHRSRKLLVLEILSNGVEILRNFEDELLPIVHQIWSPLTQRFREGEDPLIVNRSFELLLVLARFSKDFIRMRTVKEVLPNILQLLKKLSNESYLKDKGAAYRYTQAYKLQINVLENLAYIIAHLDMLDNTIWECMDCVYIYLSDNQPLTLQGAALNFFKTIHQYDENLLSRQLNDWKTQDNTHQTKNLEKLSILTNNRTSLF